MTVEEKAKLVVGMGFKFPGMPAPVKGEKPKPIGNGADLMEIYRKARERCDRGGSL